MIDTKKDLPGWKHFYSGKVRDLYRNAENPDYLLIVASDRVSAFDHILEPPIPDKGTYLTSLSNWWFERLSVPNHLVHDGPAVPEEVRGKATVAKSLEMFSVECVVRGALTGSGYQEYLDTGAVCGIALPAGLKDGDLLQEPIYTPAFKAAVGDHDENITFEQTEELVGKENAAKLRELSLNIFKTAAEIARDNGLILADTKFEFGVVPGTNEIVLADEVLTSDSSRYWDAKNYFEATGKERMQSFDKQIVRNWLNANWDKTGTPPVIPENIILETRARYKELLNKFTKLK